MPIEKEKMSKRALKLQMQCLDSLLAIKQDTGWQRILANDLNIVLNRAVCNLESGDNDTAFANAALRIVARVAEFEGIRRAQ